MRSILKGIGLAATIALVLVGLEQMSYRFSSQYASARANWIWSQWDAKGSFSSSLGSLPLDQLALAPASSLTGEDAARAESDYAERILSHTRPMRDELCESFLSGEVLREYEVRDAGGVGDFALPGLVVRANEEDVEKGWAKKVGDKIPDARALLLKVLPSREKMGEFERKEIRKRTESQYCFALGQGIACGFVHASDAEELVLAVEELRRREGRLARRLFAWGRGESAGLLAEAVNRRPELWNAVVYDSPAARSFPKPAASVAGGPWVMNFLELRGKDDDKASVEKMVQWARLGRKRERDGPFGRRMGGLFHFVNASEATGEDATSRAVTPADENTAMGYAFLFECAERRTEREPEPMPLPRPDSLAPGGRPAAEPSSYAREAAPGEPHASPPLRHLHESVSPIPEPQGWESYDCPVLRDYRADHPELVDRSDKSIILMLGRKLEKEGVLHVMGRKDPEFLFYYRNLEAISSNP